ncbi:hypothetical protein YN1_2510 [Nanoarchaeota archaeon]
MRKFLWIFFIALIIILTNNLIFSQGSYQITIVNSQPIPTPAPFQQDIAICNGNVNLGNNFAYVNNQTLFNLINSNGSNVYFVNSTDSLLYSWFEGQENISGTLCDVWWVNIPSGIPANSNLTIYMYVGPQSENYYQQYYPYTGVSAYWYCYEEGYTNMSQCLNYGIYDNGNYVFNFYDNFNGTILSPYIIIPNGASVTQDNGLTFSVTTRYQQYNVIYDYTISFPFSMIELVTYEPYVTSYTNYMFGIGIASGDSAGSPAPQMVGLLCDPNYCTYNLEVENQTSAYLSETVPEGASPLPPEVWMFTISNSYAYFTDGINYINGTYSNPQITNGYITWYFSNNNEGIIAQVSYLAIASYPPNGVMPSFSIQPAVSVTSVTLNQSFYTSCPGGSVLIAVTANINNPGGASTTVTFSCNTPSGFTCSFPQGNYCITNSTSCSIPIIIYSSPTVPPGSYNISINALTASTIFTYNIEQNVSINANESNNSVNVYIEGCGQNYTIFLNNTPYCYSSIGTFNDFNLSCIISSPGYYYIYGQTCYNGTCIDSQNITVNITQNIAISTKVVSGGGILLPPTILINSLTISNSSIIANISISSLLNLLNITVYENGELVNYYSPNTLLYSTIINLPYYNYTNITICALSLAGLYNCQSEILNIQIPNIYKEIVYKNYTITYPELKYIFENITPNYEDLNIYIGPKNNIEFIKINENNLVYIFYGQNNININIPYSNYTNITIEACNYYNLCSQYNLNYNILIPVIEYINDSKVNNSYNLSLSTYKYYNGSMYIVTKNLSFNLGIPSNLIIYLNNSGNNISNLKINIGYNGSNVLLYYYGIKINNNISIFIPNIGGNQSIILKLSVIPINIGESQLFINVSSNGNNIISYKYNLVVNYTKNNNLLESKNIYSPPLLSRMITTLSNMYIRILIDIFKLF